MLSPVWVWAHEDMLEEVIVLGRRLDLAGEARSASEGVIGQEELSLRPLLRPGDVLESIPGMIMTQHSGSGKGNQMFLRGFNLDHGTDFSTSVDGMPVNLPTHGHGQGYTDNLTWSAPAMYYDSSWNSADQIPQRAVDQGLIDPYGSLDSDDHDIDYFYASRLPGEPQTGLEDIHFHIFEPRQFRVQVSWFF